MARLPSLGSTLLPFSCFSLLLPFLSCSISPFSEETDNNAAFDTADGAHSRSHVAYVQAITQLLPRGLLLRKRRAIQVRVNNRRDAAEEQAPILTFQRLSSLPRPSRSNPQMLACSSLRDPCNCTDYTLLAAYASVHIRERNDIRCRAGGVSQLSLNGIRTKFCDSLF